MVNVCEIIRKTHFNRTKISNCATHFRFILNELIPFQCYRCAVQAIFNEFIILFLFFSFIELNIDLNLMNEQILIRFQNLHTSYMDVKCKWMNDLRFLFIYLPVLKLFFQIVFYNTKFYCISLFFSPTQIKMVLKNSFLCSTVHTLSMLLYSFIFRIFFFAVLRTERKKNRPSKTNCICVLSVSSFCFNKKVQMVFKLTS